MTDPDRSPSPRYQDFVDWLDGQIRARYEWLNTHGTNFKKWPEGDIEAKRRGLAIMRAMRAHFVDLAGAGPHVSNQGSLL